MTSRKLTHKFVCTDLSAGMVGLYVNMAANPIRKEAAP